MQHLRPISLCNTLYKVVAKLIVEKLRPHLNKWVSASQTSFVPGRLTTDNIITAQELLHRFHRASGVTDLCVWKIDLSTTYDRIEWPVLNYVLVEIGLPEKLGGLIMQCVMTVTYQVIVNGELTRTITPICGLRQGDLISPYLFISCMERLS